jgi:hypothetical protein
MSIHLQIYKKSFFFLSWFFCLFVFGFLGLSPAVLSLGLKGLQEGVDGGHLAV